MCACTNIYTNSSFLRAARLSSYSIASSYTPNFNVRWLSIYGTTTFCVHASMICVFTYPFAQCTTIISSYSLNPVESTSASRVNRFVINNDKIMSPQSVMQGMAVNNYLSCLTLCFNYPRIAFALTNFNYG